MAFDHDWDSPLPAGRRKVVGHQERRGPIMSKRSVSLKSQAKHGQNRGAMGRFFAFISLESGRGERLALIPRQWAVGSVAALVGE